MANKENAMDPRAAKYVYTGRKSLYGSKSTGGTIESR